jgi:hypothetical protein
MRNNNGLCLVLGIIIGACIMSLIMICHFVPEDTSPTIIVTGEMPTAATMIIDNQKINCRVPVSLEIKTQWTKNGDIRVYGGHIKRAGDNTNVK